VRFLLLPVSPRSGKVLLAKVVSHDAAKGTITYIEEDGSEQTEPRTEDGDEDGDADAEASARVVRVAGATPRRRGRVGGRRDVPRRRRCGARVLPLALEASVAARGTAGVAPCALRAAMTAGRTVMTEPPGVDGLEVPSRLVGEY